MPVPNTVQLKEEGMEEGGGEEREGERERGIVGGRE